MPVHIAHRAVDLDSGAKVPNSNRNLVLKWQWIVKKLSMIRMQTIVSFPGAFPEKGSFAWKQPTRNGRWKMVSQTGMRKGLMPGEQAGFCIHIIVC